MGELDDMAFLANVYGGFTRPWDSTIDPRNGEDAYSALVAEHLSRTAVVVEAGCGHGTEALRLASQVGELIAFDRSEPFLEIAERARTGAGIANVRFVATDSSPKRNTGRLLPVDDSSVDLVISRRGPSSWIADAPRAVRPGGVLIYLGYLETPVASWNDELPASLRMIERPDPMPATVLDRLAAAAIELHSSWLFDVPEVFTDPAELYNRLVWDRRRAQTPRYDDVREVLEGVFARPNHAAGVVLRHRRFLAKAVVDGGRTR